MRIATAEEIAVLELLAVELELAIAVSVVSHDSLPRPAPREDRSALALSWSDSDLALALADTDVVQSGASDDPSDPDPVEYATDRSITPPAGVLVLPRRPITARVAGARDLASDRLCVVTEPQAGRD